jgi:hypothetical protein
VIDPDRLAELDTFRLDEDTPDDARVSLPARDVRDLVSLISVVRAAIAMREGLHGNVEVYNYDFYDLVRRFDEERAT